MFAFRRALAADAGKLPAIERSAGAIFRQIADLAWIADDEVLPVQRHLALIEKGTTWVALAASDELVGFLSAEVTGANIHIWELAVRNDQQGRGIGRGLMATAREWAVDNGLTSMTLTTFRNVPWNEPFYRAIGFRTLSGCDITPALARILSAEADAGLPSKARCAMVLTLV